VVDRAVRARVLIPDPAGMTGLMLASQVDLRLKNRVLADIASRFLNLGFNMLDVQTLTLGIGDCFGLNL